MAPKMVALVAALVALASCTDQPGAPDVRPTSVESTEKKKVKTKRTPVADEQALLYVRAATLHAYDLDSGEESVLTGLFSDDVALSPNGMQLAVVRDLAPGTNPEGFGDPVLMVGPVGSRDFAQLGPGRSPLWSPDGQRVAVIDTSGVVVYDVDGGGEDLVLEGEGWALVGWTTDGIAAAGPDGVAIGVVGEEPAFIDLAPAELWGVSPSDRVALSVEGPSLVDLDTDESRTANVADALGGGAWAPDGSEVALVELRGRGQLVLLDTASGEGREVAEGAGAQGSVVWSADAERFAFARIDPADRFRFQAVICTRDGECGPAFTWERGVNLLGFSSVTR